MIHSLTKFYERLHDQLVMQSPRIGYCVSSQDPLHIFPAFSQQLFINPGYLEHESACRLHIDSLSIRINVSATSSYC